MKQRAVEKHYSVPEAAFLLNFTPTWVRAHAAELARFGGVYLIPGKKGKRQDYRISASAINGWLEQFQIQSIEKAWDAAGIFARSESELKRKIAAMGRNGCGE